MKKLLFLFIYISLVSCGDDEEILGDCVVAPNLDRVCTEEYQPVCGCDGTVYANSCEAEREGILMWKSTNKDVGEECSF
tara:strand:- start:168 stop:404 length:237 start_codon:yes stop_codon:yes gene_type:complete